jgi:EcsC protein family
MRMLAEDVEQLRSAKYILENPGITAKLTNLVGSPIEKGLKLLPGDWREKVGTATHDALMTALKGALLTMGPGSKAASPRWHKFAAAMSGGIGGAFGLPALIVELPVSTTIMLRSIADIGRSHGEVLSTARSQIACLEVFALGGPSENDDSSESGYFAVRSALARAVTEASKYLAEKTVAEEGAPALVRLIATIAARFQVQVSEKAAAMAVPLLGAIGGGGINLLFIDHFQDMSRGHFVVRKLERKYDQLLVRDIYESL